MNTATAEDLGKGPLSRKDAFRETVNGMMNVSTVPTVLKKIMDLTGNPNTVIHDLVKVIERDQAIAMRVVAASNAAYYGFSRKIRTISQAILILGYDMVKGLAITTTVFNSMPSKDRERLMELWAHSFETAQAAALIAQKTGAIEKESAFLAGLFHDIGRPILCQACGDDAALSPFDRSSIEKEEEAFGAGHAEAGSWFAARFNIPEDSTLAIRYHHNPEACAKAPKLPPMVAIIYLANFIVSGKDAVASPEHDAILASLKLAKEDLASVGDEVEAFKETVRSFYI
ncbi:MAG: HDOD domain-containing protein [Deltaproteobacteria bacterium]|nr:HDOD domain-containing protein [Deltaproteobacteria bacterium]